MRKSGPQLPRRNTEVVYNDVHNIHNNDILCQGTIAINPKYHDVIKIKVLYKYEEVVVYLILIAHTYFIPKKQNSGKDTLNL